MSRNPISRGKHRTALTPRFEGTRESWTGRVPALGRGAARPAPLRRAAGFVVEMTASPELWRGSGDAILEILRPANGVGMMRNLLTRSRAITTGVHVSWRVGQVAVEGNENGEGNACLILDADPAVRHYSTQPMAISYRLAGRETYHIPDFEVVRHCGSILLWDIQSSAMALEEDIVQRSRFMMRELPRLGYEYAVATHRELCMEPRLGTARELCRYGHHPLDLRTREQVLDAFRRLGRISWGTILNGGLGPNGRDAVCRLTLEGALNLDRSRPMSPQSCFSLPEIAKEICR